MFQYYETYVGPQYDIHFKYSELETICTIAFFYGPGIPILFPLGFIAISMISICERIALAKLFRQPPRYSVDLTLDSIRFVQWTPIFYLLFGFWMFSNRQAFDNRVIQVQTSLELIRYDHHIIESLYTISPGLPFFLVFVILVSFKLIVKFRKIGFSKVSELEDFHMNDIFYSTILESHKKEIMLHETFL